MIGGKPNQMEELHHLQELLSALLTEARGTLKDLRQERREIERYIADEVRTRIESTVATQLAELGEVTKTQMDISVERVNAKFDELHALLIGTDRQSRRAGKTPLPDLIANHVEARGD